MNDSVYAQALGRDQLDIHTTVQVCEWQDMVSAPLDTEVLVSDGEAIAVARVHAMCARIRRFPLSFMGQRATSVPSASRRIGCRCRFSRAQPLWGIRPVACMSVSRDPQTTRSRDPPINGSPKWQAADATRTLLPSRC